MEEGLKDVEVFSTDLSAVDQVEKLQEDKCCKDVSQVFGFGLRLDVELICISFGVVKISGIKTIWHSNFG